MPYFNRPFRMRLSAVLLPLLALLPAVSAHADVYGYVDAQGEVHLASSALDQRYQLFQKTPPAGSGHLNDNLALDTLAPASPGVKSGKAPAYDPKRAAIYSRLIAQTAREFKLDANLLHSIVTVESGYNPQAISAKGAVGLMQVLPATGARFGISALDDPKHNLRAGARYLRFLMTLFHNDLPLVIAAYNAGEGAVQKYRNTIPPYDETRDYVAKVLASYEKRGGLAAMPRRPGGRIHAIIRPDTSL